MSSQEFYKYVEVGEGAGTVGNSDWMTQTSESVILDGYDS